MNDGLSEDKADAFAQQLHEETQQERQQEEQKQSELLDAVAQDDDLGGTDTARFGDAEVIHKSWIPGKQLEQLRRAHQAMESGEASTLDNDVTLLTDMTEQVRNVRTNETMTDDALIHAFWEDMIQRYGVDGIKLINDRVLGPVLKETRRKMNALKSFRGSGQGNPDGDGDELDGADAEGISDTPADGA